MPGKRSDCLSAGAEPLAWPWAREGGCGRAAAGSGFAMHTAVGADAEHEGALGARVHVCVMGSREMDAAGHPPRESEDGWGREKDQGHHFPSEQVECKCTWATLGWSEVCPHKSLASPEGTDWLSFPFWRWSLW